MYHLTCALMIRGNKNLPFWRVSLITAIFFSSVFSSQAQDRDIFLNLYNNQSEITAPRSITLQSGFHIPSGKSVRLYIDACTQLGSAPSTSQNYISTKVFKTPGVTSANVNNPWSVCDVSETIQYFDGLGRPLQTVQVKASPALKDIVQPVAYDAFGRETKRYLPYASSSADGSYKAGALIDQQAFYNAPPTGIPVIPTAFAETRFEPSPLNRIEEQGAPGAPWQLGSGHTVRTEYTSNNNSAFSSSNTTGSRRVALYTAVVGASDNARTLSRTNNNAIYANNQLYVTIIKDENWKPADECVGTTEEYKDKEGRIVLKRSYNKRGSLTEMLSIYYVYDDFGNLCFVLPPASGPDADAAISSTTLENLCYQYRYDGRGRMTGKKLPGKGWEFMIYNTLDQLVLSQDALQRNKTPQQWSFSKYDGLGRIVITGIFADAGTTADAAAMPSDTRRVALQTTVGALTTNLWETRVTTAPAATETGYSNVSYPTSGVNLYLSINYYDNYNLLPGGNPYDYSGSTMTKGLLTASRVKVLKASPASGTSEMLWNLNYYDDQGRVAKSYSQHYKGGGISASNYDEIINSYSFTDELLASTRIHHVNGSSAVVKVLTENKYDHVGRLTATSQQINDENKVALVQNTYNEVGQLLDKELHNKSQKSTYSYNARGWMTGLNSSQFSLKLKYEDGTVPQWNGNISRQEFTGGSYDYSYDRLNRLTDGIAAAADGRSEKSISYDLNGNIMALQRYSSASNLEDNLTYQYTGNRLTGVTDASTLAGTQFQRPGTTSYSYDLNGNMTARTNTVNTQNNLSAIVYNVLNLPQSLKAGATDITYVYDATGRKLRKVSGTVATDYISGVQYTGNTLDFIQNEVGRAIPNGASYKYEYNLSDHLGNVRYSFDVNSSGIVGLTQRDDYYPFGLRIAKQVSSLENKYLYNGKEIQPESNLYDYGARFYDPVIARFTTVDPLAEKMRRYSPYNYALDNPIRFIDPDGRSPEDTNDGPPGKRVSVSVTAVSAIKLNADLKKASGVPATFLRSATGEKLVSSTTFGATVGDGKVTDASVNRDHTVLPTELGGHTVPFGLGAGLDPTSRNQGGVIQGQNGVVGSTSKYQAEIGVAGQMVGKTFGADPVTITQSVGIAVDPNGNVKVAINASSFPSTTYTTTIRIVNEDGSTSTKVFTNTFRQSPVTQAVKSSTFSTAQKPQVINYNINQ
jgi:RHS repeat-associated protein